MMFGREMRNKMPDIKRRSNSDEEVRDKDWRNKIKGKEYADARRRAAPNPLAVGDKVLVKADKKDKLTPTFEPSPQTVVARQGGEVVVENM